MNTGSHRLHAVSPPRPPHGSGERHADAPDLRAARELRLVAEAREGNAAAWARLYQDNFDRLYRDVRYMVSDAGSAEEIVQESFARALTSLPRFDGRSSFPGWLRGIAHNLVRRRWRTDERRGRAYDRLLHTQNSSNAGSEADPEALHVQTQRAKVLREVLTTLPPALRETFVMRDVQGLAVEEVAERLCTTPGNIRVRANRARAKIREQLETLGWLTPEVAS